MSARVQIMHLPMVITFLPGEHQKQKYPGWGLRSHLQKPQDPSTDRVSTSRRGRTHLSCSGVVSHRCQLDVLDLDVAALERRPVHPCSSRV